MDVYFMPESNINQGQIDDKRQYKKMAGTAAVFIEISYPFSSPVERDGMIWSVTELGLQVDPVELRWKQPLANSLALEGLEEYDPPQNGEARYVTSQGVAFYYFQPKKAWIQLTASV